MKLTLALALLSLFALPAHAQNCESITASISGGWKPISTASRDGTIVEMLETYGVAPWYGLFKWTKGSYDIPVTDYINGKKIRTHIEHFSDSTPSWHDVTDPQRGVAEDSCLFWRPYKKTGAYVDPTGGAQNSVAYWCAHMGFAYNKKKDVCEVKP